MPALPKSGPSFFLGIELATDQLRASLVDETLELVGVERIDFDNDLPEYQTQGGIFTTPGDAYTTPVEMWVKALDHLLERLHRNYDLSKIKAIGGAAQHALVWWKSVSVPSLSSLDPHLPLHKHFPAPTFAMPNTAVAQDTSSQTHAAAIETLLGGADSMATRVGMCANPSMVSAQMLRVRETWPQEVWARTGRVQLASAFFGSLMTGKWVPMSEPEACATGAWVHGGAKGSSAATGGHWDENVLDIVSGSREEGRRVRGWLGDVDVSGGRRVGTVSRYLVERYGFDPETIVAPFTSDYLSAYMSLLPSNNDAVLSFGPMDTLLTPAQNYTPTRLYSLFPHPAQDSTEKRRYIAVLSSRNADVPRALVRDMYTKSWSAFDRLVAIVPPGGSIGLDDKLFSFWHLAGDSYPFSRVKGIFRFETGIKVNEFRDLRANPRCLIESQLLSFRMKWANLVGSGVLAGSRKVGLGVGVGGSLSRTPPPPGTPVGSTASNPGSKSPSTSQQAASSSSSITTSSSSSSLLPSSTSLSSSTSSSLGVSFDPYDIHPLPTRVLAIGAAANFPSISNIICDVFNAPVYVPLTQVDGAQVMGAHRNAPADGFPSRASLGGAYFARWVWGGRGAGLGSGELGGSGAGLGVGVGGASGGGTGGTLRSFEDEMRRILGKRWLATGGTVLRSHTNGLAGSTTGTSSTSLPPLSSSSLSSLSGLSSTSGHGSSGHGPPPPVLTGGMTLGIGPRAGGSSSGTSTPFGHTRSTLGGTVFSEEEEDAELQLQQQLHRQLSLASAGGSTSSGGPGGGPLSPGIIGSGTPPGSARLMRASSSHGDLVGLGSSIMSANGGSSTSTSATPTSTSSVTTSGTTTATTTSSGTAAGGGGTNPNPTPLTPVVALATGDVEAQLGLAKVAEPDVDAFMTYAAIVPEYARLEGMLVKGIV